MHFSGQGLQLSLFLILVYCYELITADKNKSLINLIMNASY